MKKILTLFILSLMLLSLLSPVSLAVNEASSVQNIKAKSAILTEVTTGTVLYEYKSDKKLFPASVTKIMTILLAVEAIENGKIKLDDMVVCSENAASKGGSQIWLEPNEKMSVNDLLKATVIGSANDAATLLGEYISGTEDAFISLMNKRAKELGMKNTHFVNATGLDDETDEHLTTARDIGIMSCELLKHKMILDYSTVWMDTLRNGKTELVNTNKLVRFFDGTTGLKTGTTDKAGCCLSASCERDGLHLVAVVLGSDTSNDRFNSAKALLNRGFSEFCVYKPEIDDAIKKEIKIFGGESEYLKPELPEIKSLIIKKEDKDNIKQVVDICSDVEAPVEKGQKLGDIKFMNGNDCIAQYEITSPEAVGTLTFKLSFKRILNYILCGKLISD